MTEKPNDILPPKKRSLGKRIAKFIGFFLIVTILLFVLAVFALDNYLQSNKAKIFEQLPFLNNGSISFDEAQISIYKNFPSATISLQNLQVKDSLFPQHQIPFLKIGELRTALSLSMLWEKEVELKSIELHDGQINFHTDSSGYKIIQGLFSKPAKPPNPDEKNDFFKDFKIQTDPLNISLYNIDIRLVNVRKKLSIRGKAEQLLVKINLHDEGLSAEVDMQIALNEMTFNKDKGTFLKDSKLIGKPTIHLQNGILSFEPFELQINDELFNFKGVYDTKKKTKSNLVLVNKNTRWEKIKPLLTDSIQSKIVPYFIQNPFYTKTIIKGFFRRGEPVTVDIDFQMEENELKVFHFDLNRVNLQGRFVNRNFKNKFDTEGRKGITLEVRELTTDFQGFQVRTRNTLITALPKTVPQLVADVQIHGKSDAIGDWLSNDNFFFHDGYFDLSAQVNGPVNDFKRLMILSNAFLELNEINVYYKPADIIFPFKRLTLSKKSGNADFLLMSSTPGKKHNFQLIGFLHNLPALLVNLKDQRARSQAEFTADKIGWRDFVDWFGKKGNLSNEKSEIKTNTERQKKRTMKQTIRGIQNKFQPHLTLNIDTLSYYDLLRIDKFITNIYFEDENHLVFDKTSFNYDKGSIDFTARLDISDSLQTPFEFELYAENLNLKKLLPPLDYFNIKLLANLEKLPENLNLRVKLKGIIDDHTGIMPNTSTGVISFDIDDGELLAGKITYEPDLISTNDSIENKVITKTKILFVGDPSLFNDFLKTEQFFFSKGRFYFTFDYQGDQTNLEDIINSSSANLKIHNSSVHYKPTAVDFPLTNINLYLESGNADFDLLIRSDSLRRQIQLIGMIENLSELVIGNTGKSIKTTVDATSPKIVWDHFFRLFVPEAAEPAIHQTKKQKMDALKATIKGVFNYFDPSLDAQFDTLVLTDKFTVMNFKTGIYMADSNNLILEKTAFDYHDGSMSFDGQFDFNASGPLPFTANFRTKDLDIEKLLSSLNYVSLPSLQSIEKLSGRITMKLDLSGLIAEDGSGLINEATKGLLDFKLNDVEIRGMPTLDTIANQVRMEKRFADLSFAPIENRITIDGQNIEIPLMEIQSNAINLFLEGTLSYGDQTNIWITIPLDNLKKADRSIVPPKRGYAAIKNKIFIEVTSDEAGNNKFKLRTSKRKFYKSRGIISQYRKDKRKYKKIRKNLKKSSRD